MDESFIDFCGEDASLIKDYKYIKNLILIRSFTKAYSIPGLRLAHALCADDEIRSRISKNLPEWNVSTYASRAGEICLMEDEYIKKARALVDEEKKYLTSSFASLGITVFPSDANFMMLKDDRPLYEELLQRGILVRDLSDMRGLGTGYIRVAVRCHEEI